MRFMIIVKATPDTEAGIMPAQSLFDAMTAYNQELARAGVLLDANGLRPSRDGWRIRYDEGRRTVTDGPFADTRELIAGYTLIGVRSREEAMEWSRRFPNPHGEFANAEIEVRQLYEPADLPS
ncbi:YciI family protein [Massilia sp. UBA6681]|uniref:YciI family protein n=1 Tax=Massilia sp. UBA6681 TaxID=1946839 RepID=UPI0025B94789|nr:YciI family protein [Massilia sp. UBA6681]